MGKPQILCDCNILHENIVSEVESHIVSKHTLLEMAEFYRMLSDTTRIRIIAALYVSEMCVCDIAVLLNTTKSVISHQLKNLKASNFIKSRKEGREVFYSLKDDHVRLVFEICLDHIKESHYETKD